MEKEGEPRSEKIDDEEKREDAFLAHDVTRNLSFSSSLHHPVAFSLSLFIFFVFLRHSFWRRTNTVHES